MKAARARADYTGYAGQGHYYDLAKGQGFPENLPLIRQNSVCVFLKRDLHKLRTDGRPLSIKYGVDALYKVRLPLYQAWCDLEADSNKSIEQTAKAIREALGI